MSFPPDLPTVNLNFGPYLDAAGEPHTDLVFRVQVPRPILWTPTGAVVIPEAVRLKTNEIGTATVTLPATDAEGLSVVGFTYTVTGPRSVLPRGAVAVALPQVVPDVDFDTLAPASASDGTTVWTPDGLTPEAVEQILTDALNASPLVADAVAGQVEVQVAPLVVAAATSAEAAEDAQAGAETAAASVQRDQPNGVAPLDEDKLVPAANLPMGEIASAPEMRDALVQLARSGCTGNETAPRLASSDVGRGAFLRSLRRCPRPRVCWNALPKMGAAPPLLEQQTGPDDSRMSGDRHERHYRAHAHRTQPPRPARPSRVPRPVHGRHS